MTICILLGLIIFNLILRFKASGHAAGVAGPIGAMIYLYGLIATPLIALLPLVTWARITAKGHDIWQTVVGAMLSIEIKLITWSNFQVFTWSFRRYTARCFSDIL